MDKFAVKRKADRDESPSKKTRSTDRLRPTFVIAPGASGGVCPDLREVLGRMGKVVGLTKWAGNFPSQMNANVALLEKAALDARAGGDAMVLVGHSFGCRVVAELMAKDASFTVALFESYPLYGPSVPKTAALDRVAPLLRLRPEARVCFFSGARDEFLARAAPKGWRGAGEPTGAAALHAVVARMPCAAGATVFSIDGAGHDALKVAKSKVLNVQGQLLRAVEALISELAPAPQEAAAFPGQGRALGGAVVDLTEDTQDTLEDE
ncbi:hypothetical protein M885DRAFT_585407 [Pelagophyceae sp. CCMP2097]|nr:hypothetical protein M885DRAFT_585407 [Pelagophyceae sp. CCMP2097]|mmetsp:Transcript_3924/g.12073  ORF Transcript_3924/g.12073 Transcript_3924/m.12073 type:complete len:265 (+) Transcript_3924:43-837(+)